MPARRDRSASPSRTQLKREVERNDEIISEKASRELVELGIVGAVLDEEIRLLESAVHSASGEVVGLSDDIRDQADALQALNEAVAKRELQRCMNRCSTAVADIAAPGRVAGTLAAAPSCAGAARRPPTASSLGECRPKQVAVIRRFVRPRLRRLRDNVCQCERLAFAEDRRQVEELRCKAQSEVDRARDAAKQQERAAEAARMDLEMHFKVSRADFASLQKRLQEQEVAHEQLRFQLREQRHLGRARAKADRLTIRGFEGFASLLSQFGAWASQTQRSCRRKVEQNAREIAVCLERRTNEFAEQLTSCTHDFRERLHRREILCARLGRERLQQAFALRRETQRSRHLKLVLQPWRHYAAMLGRERSSAGLGLLRTRCALAEANLRSVSLQFHYVDECTAKDVSMVRMRSIFWFWSVGLVITRSRSDETRWRHHLILGDSLSIRRHSLRLSLVTWRLSAEMQIVRRESTIMEGKLIDAQTKATQSHMYSRRRTLQGVSGNVSGLLLIIVHAWVVARRVFQNRRKTMLSCDVTFRTILASSVLRNRKICFVGWRLHARVRCAIAIKLRQTNIIRIDRNTLTVVHNFCAWSLLTARTREVRIRSSQRAGFALIAQRFELRWATYIRSKLAFFTFIFWQLWRVEKSKRGHWKSALAHMVTKNVQLYRMAVLIAWRHASRREEEKLRQLHGNYATHAKQLVSVALSSLEQYRFFVDWKSVVLQLRLERLSHEGEQERSNFNHRLRLRSRQTADVTTHRNRNRSLLLYVTVCFESWRQEASLRRQRKMQMAATSQLKQAQFDTITRVGILLNSVVDCMWGRDAVHSQRSLLKLWCFSAKLAHHERCREAQLAEIANLQSRHHVEYLNFAIKNKQCHQLCQVYLESCGKEKQLVSLLVSVKAWHHAVVTQHSVAQAHKFIDEQQRLREKAKRVLQGHIRAVEATALCSHVAAWKLVVLYSREARDVLRARSRDADTAKSVQEQMAAEAALMQEQAVVEAHLLKEKMAAEVKLLQEQATTDATLVREQMVAEAQSLREHAWQHGRASLEPVIEKLRHTLRSCASRFANLESMVLLKMIWSVWRIDAGHLCEIRTVWSHHMGDRSCRWEPDLRASRQSCKWLANNISFMQTRLRQRAEYMMVRWFASTRDATKWLVFNCLRTLSTIKRHTQQSTPMILRRNIQATWAYVALVFLLWGALCSRRRYIGKQYALMFADRDCDLLAFVIRAWRRSADSRFSFHRFIRMSLISIDSSTCQMCLERILRLWSLDTRHSITLNRKILCEQQLDKQLQSVQHRFQECTRHAAHRVTTARRCVLSARASSDEGSILLIYKLIWSLWSKAAAYRRASLLIRTRSVWLFHHRSMQRRALLSWSRVAFQKRCKHLEQDTSMKVERLELEAIQMRVEAENRHHEKIADAIEFGIQWDLSNITSMLFYLWGSRVSQQVAGRVAKKIFEKVTNAIEFGIHQDLSNIISMLFYLWSTRASQQAAGREAEQLLKQWQHVAKRITVASINNDRFALLRTLLKMWRNLALPRRVDASAVACIVTRETGVLARVTTSDGEVLARAPMMDAAILTDRAREQSKTTNAAQARLQLLWDWPGLNCAFSVATKPEQAFRTVIAASSPFEAMCPLGTTHQATFRRIAAALLRGHFLIVARTYAVWHAWTLLFVEPSLIDSAGELTRSACRDAAGHLPRPISAPSPPRPTFRATDDATYLLSSASPSRAVGNNAQGGRGHCFYSNPTPLVASEPLPPPLPHYHECTRCASPPRSSCSAGPLSANSSRSRAHVHIHSPSPQRQMQKHSQVPYTPSTAATNSDFHSAHNSVNHGSMCSRSSLDTSSDLLTELHAEASALRIENCAIAERHWLLCAEVRNTADTARGHLRMAARASATGDERLSLDQAAQIGRWILEVTDRLRSLTTFVQAPDLQAHRSGYTPLRSYVRA